MKTTNQNYKVADATNSNINDIINHVSASIGSLFTKDDVITVLRMINVIDKPNESEKPSYDALLKLIYKVRLEIETEISNSIPNEFDDISDYDLRLNGNEIKVDSVNVDTSDMESDIISIVNDGFDELINSINTETE